MNFLWAGQRTGAFFVGRLAGEFFCENRRVLGGPAAIHCVKENLCSWGIAVIIYYYGRDGL